MPAGDNYLLTVEDLGDDKYQITKQNPETFNKNLLTTTGGKKSRKSRLKKHRKTKKQRKTQTHK